MSDISIMPRAGSVPMQGVSVAGATTERRRGHRGEVGKGTPGSRLKGAWRRWQPTMKVQKGRSERTLRAFARLLADDDKDSMQEDAIVWLETKTHVLPPDVKRLMREAKRRKRAKPRKSSKDRRASGSRKRK